MHNYSGSYRIVYIIRKFLNHEFFWHNHYRFYVTILSCTNIIFKWVVHTKICTNDPLYGVGG